MISQPSRAERRKAAGRPCTACHEPMHHLDVARIHHPAQGTVYLHVECLNMLAERMDAADNGDDDLCDDCGDDYNDCECG